MGAFWGDNRPAIRGVPLNDNRDKLASLLVHIFLGVVVLFAALVFARNTVDSHARTRGHEPLVEACKENTRQLKRLEKRLAKLDGAEPSDWHTEIEDW